MPLKKLAGNDFSSVINYVI